MKALIAYMLLIAISCYAISAAFNRYDPMARRLRRQDEIEQLIKTDG